MHTQADVPIADIHPRPVAAEDLRPVAVETGPRPVTAEADAAPGSLQRVKDAVAGALQSTQQAVTQTANTAYQKLDEAGVPQKLNEHLTYGKDLAAQHTAQLREQAQANLAAGQDYLYSTADRVRNATPEEINESSVAKIGAGFLLLALSCALIGINLKIALGLVVLCGLGAYLYQFKGSGAHKPRGGGLVGEGNAVRDMQGAVGAKAQEVGSKMGATAQDAGYKVGQTAQDVGNQMGATAQDAGYKMDAAVRDVGNKMGATAQDAGYKTDATARDVGNKVADFGTGPNQFQGADVAGGHTPNSMADMGTGLNSAGAPPGFTPGAPVGTQAVVSEPRIPGPAPRGMGDDMLPDGLRGAMGGTSAGLTAGAHDKPHQLHDEAAHQAAQVAGHREMPHSLHPAGISESMDLAHHLSAEEAAKVAQQYLPKPEIKG